jgi:hypothetical protein
MLYQGYSNVSEADLQNAVREFNCLNIKERVVSHIYEDSELRKHPKINEIITESANNFDAELREGELESKYLQRMENMKTESKQETLKAIHQFFQEPQESQNVSSNFAPLQQPELPPVLTSENRKSASSLINQNPATVLENRESASSLINQNSRQPNQTFVPINSTSANNLDSEPQRNQRG